MTTGKRTRGGTWADAAVLALIGLLAAGFYFWTSTSNSPLPRQPGPAPDYYNMLVRGLRSGHLYMDVVPDPALLALPADQRPGNAPYLLDASLRGNHYYLYFGVTPAVTVFLPCAVLAGRELPVELAVAGQAAIGCWLALVLLLVLRREFFPRAGRATLSIAGLALAFATAVPVTLRKSEVYEAACTAGFLWSTALMLFMTLAVIRQSRRTLWLALASVSLGLAVGSRPNLVVGAGALGGVALWLWWRADGALRTRRGRWLAAAIGPAASCGAALAFYNYARFGDPLEIGHRFQVGSIADNYFSFGYFPHNLAAYYLTPPSVSWFFPLFSPGHEGARPLHYMGIEYANGQWLMLPLAFAAFGLALVFSRRWLARTNLAVVVAALGFWLVANFALVGSLSARANRYMLDFHPALVLLVCLTLLAVSSRGGWWRVASFAGSFGLVLASLFNLAISFQVHEFFQQKNPAGFAAIERVANRVVWPLHRWFAPPFGPLEARVVFADTPAGRREPLLTTGAPMLSNSLTMVTAGPGRAWLEFDHEGEGGSRGPEFSFPPGRDSRLKVWLGSLLPPENHPWFEGSDHGDIVRQKQSVVVELDGEVIFRSSAVPHEASPGQVQLGTRFPSYSDDRATFSGRFLSVRRFPGQPPVPSPSTPEEPLAYALKIMLPIDRFGLIEPLLATGRTGQGDLLVVQYVSHKSIRLGHDQIGSGIEWSDPVAVDYAVPQALEVTFDDDGASDALAPRRAAGWRSIVRLNGREVWRAKNPHHPFVPGEVAAGCNPIGASCRRYFGGAILNWEFLGDGLLRERAAPTGFARALALAQLPRELAADSAQPLMALRNRRDQRGVLAVRGAGANVVQLGWLEGDSQIWSEKISLISGAPVALEAAWNGGSTPAAAANAGVSADAFMRGRLSVFWNGVPVFRPRSEFWDAPIQAVVGGRSGWPSRDSLAARFSGKFFRRDRAEAAPASNWNLGPTRRFRATVRFPTGRAGICEPLLTSGRTGAADGVFVRYLSDEKIRLGFDHWGTGGPESAPLAVDFSVPHEVEVSLGEGPWTQGGVGPVLIRIDGREAIAGMAKFHPARAGEIVFGENLVGLSTSVPEFSGVLISLEGR